MAFTGKFGTSGSLPGDMILGGKGPTGGGGEIDVDASNAIALTSTAVAGTIDVVAEDTLSLTDLASTTTPHHEAAESTLSFTITVGSSIKMLTASSPISLVQAAASSTLEVSASSTLALVSAARATILEVAGVSALSITDEARPGLFKPVALSTLSLVQTIVESGVRRTPSATSTLALTSTASTPRVLHKSASSTLALTSAAVGVGPYKPTASSPLSLTDSARSGVWPVSASSPITLTDEGRKAETYNADTTSTLPMTSVASAFNLHVYATSTLTLTDSVENREKFRSVTDTLSLTSTATAEIIRAAISTLTLTDLAVCTSVSKTAESELELEDEARNISIKLFAEEQTINLTQSATTNIKMQSLEDALSLVSTLFVNRPWYASATSELITIEEVFDLETFSLIEVVTGLQDSASCTLITVRPTSNIISFATQALVSHQRADGIDCEAESVLTLTQEGRISIPKSAASTMALSQSATATTSRPAVSELSTLGVAADVLVVRGVSATNTLSMQQSVAFILEKNDTLCTYSPFIGSSSDPNAPEPPPATYPAAGGTPGFRLQYPASGGVTDQLILRAPNLGNLDRLAMTRINRETRGGTLIIYADPVWPKVETLLLSFSGLSYDEGQSLLAFMETYLGQEIRLIDWEDRLWRGVITNPSDPVVPDGPGCKYTASFEFEGEKV